MCTYIALLIPTTADIARAIELGRSVGFDPNDDLPRSLARATSFARLLDPRRGHCDCGTSIGRETRKPTDRDDLDRRSREGPRAKWSASKRSRWIEQQLEHAHRQPSPISADSDPEIAAWCAFARSAARDAAVARIGLVVQNWDDRVASWQPPVATSATPEHLRAVAFRTPTWLCVPIVHGP